MKDMKIDQIVMALLTMVSLSLGLALDKAHAGGSPEEQTIEVLSKTNKFLGKAGGAVKIVKVISDVGEKTYDYSKDKTSGEDVYITACRSVTTVSTGYMGAVAGAEAGAAIGFVIAGPFGAAAGSLIGGIAGGFGGAFGGEKGFDCLMGSSKQ